MTACGGQWGARRPFATAISLRAALALVAVTLSAAFAVEIPRFGAVNPDLYRGGRPSEEDVAALREMGIKTVLDLEGGLFVTETETVRRERSWVEAAGIDFVHVPLSPVGAPRPALVEEAVAVMADPARRPVFVHCYAGANRTGYVVAAYRVRAEGWTPERAYDEMVRLGFHRYLFWWTAAFTQYTADVSAERRDRSASNADPEEG